MVADLNNKSVRIIRAQLSASGWLPEQRLDRQRLGGRAKACTARGLV
ncbi:MAG: hypothetical protein OSB15_09960 [Amylibacter sp.]|nr:hypothetical protein [Amylibacter sp.]